MSVFAISDLHLSFSTDKSMDVFGGKWKNYTDRMLKNWNSVVAENDLVIIPGDISWAMNLEDTLKDFMYINNLNGKKLLLRGNHDYWWSTLTKMQNFIKKNSLSTISFLQNNAAVWEDYVICGTRGWIIAKDNSSADDKKIYERERQRLILSLEEASAYKNKKIIAAMHYPPIEKNDLNGGFMDILQNYSVNECIFGHLHDSAHMMAPTGLINGIKFSLVSCDYLNFIPLLIKK